MIVHICSLICGCEAFSWQVKALKGPYPTIIFHYFLNLCQLIFRMNPNLRPPSHQSISAKPAPYTPVLCQPLHQPHIFHPIPCLPETSDIFSAATSVMFSNVWEIRSSLSTRMNIHRSSAKSTNNLSFPAAIHTKSQQSPFNSCWDVLVLWNIPSNTRSLAAILN